GRLARNRCARLRRFGSLPPAAVPTVAAFVGPRATWPGRRLAPAAIGAAHERRNGRRHPGGSRGRGGRFVSGTGALARRCGGGRSSRDRLLGFDRPALRALVLHPAGELHLLLAIGDGGALEAHLRLVRPRVLLDGLRVSDPTLRGRATLV